MPQANRILLTLERDSSIPSRSEGISVRWVSLRPAHGLRPTPCPCFRELMAVETSFLYAASSRHEWRSLTSIRPGAISTVNSAAITRFSSCIRLCSRRQRQSLHGLIFSLNIYSSAALGVLRQE